MSAADNMKQVAKGGAMFTMGTMSAFLLKLIIGVIVIRYIAVAEYGLISFGYVLANIAVVIASLGLRNSVPRLIARERQLKSGPRAVGEVSGTSLLVTGLGALAASVAFYLGAETIARQLDKPGLGPVLEVFAFMIPPLALLQGLTAVFQGRQQAKPKALFEDAAVHVARLLLVGAAILVGMQFHGVLYAYVGSVWVGFGAFIVYAIYQHGQIPVFMINVSIVPSMLAFSLPLLGVGLVNRLTDWVGTLILGMTQTAEQVAMYMAPSRLQILLIVPMMALGFIYTPIATRLHAARDMVMLKNLYSTSTKWSALLTLPLAFYFIIDAGYVVTTLFGDKYAGSSVVLQVMAAGYSIHCLAGPNLSTLISCGYPRLVFYGSLVAAVSAVAISLMLIPRFGAVGAAASTGAALILSNIFASVMLHRTTGVHPFSLDYVYSVASLAVAAVVIQWLFQAGGFSGHVWHLLILMALYVFAFAFPFLTSSVATEDKEILQALERRFFGKTTYSDRIKVRS